ncbi:unnamed protein product [Dovyalis caffra]|uniref:Uncharacterized protein n=1 Tax=Dovyalis caffra TaxID=77055 RepID=A0AAV1SDH4_9ROSI|nr:unnamed protein product [Dovyalis caffra]
MLMFSLFVSCFTMPNAGASCSLSAAQFLLLRKAVYVVCSENALSWINLRLLQLPHSGLRVNEHAILSTSTQTESLGVASNNTTLPLIFKACTTLNAVEKGKKKHSSIQGTNLAKDVGVGTAVVFYCKCGLLEEVNQVFDKITQRFGFV